MHEINFVVKHNEGIDKAKTSYERRMRELHLDYVENHEHQGAVERFRNAALYKVAYLKWRRCCSKSLKMSKRWVEYDGRIFDIDWQKTGGQSALRLIAETLEREEGSKNC